MGKEKRRGIEMRKKGIEMGKVWTEKREEGGTCLRKTVEGGVREGEWG